MSILWILVGLMLLVLMPISLRAARKRADLEPGPHNEWAQNNSKRREHSGAQENIDAFSGGPYVSNSSALGGGDD
jgi:hypothetical protein